MDCKPYIPTRFLKPCRFFCSNIFTLVLVWFGGPFLTAQKVVEKSILNSGISLIQIDANNCFELLVGNSDSEELLIEGIIDGEYQKDLLVNVREEGNTVIVNAGFHPNFENPNDKLSAHKVVSIALHVKLPKNKNVSINGKSCNVSIVGVHKQVSVTLNDGRCILTENVETSSIKTQSGNITIISAQTDIMAESKYGIVTDNPIPSGGSQLNIATVTGNIYLRKTE